MQLMMSLNPLVPSMSLEQTVKAFASQALQSQDLDSIRGVERHHKLHGVAGIWQTLFNVNCWSIRVETQVINGALDLSRNMCQG